MEIRRSTEEVEDNHVMQISGNNGIVHNMEFMSQAYLRNQYSSEIDIHEEFVSSYPHEDAPLPIFLKVFFSLSLSLSFSFSETSSLVWTLVLIYSLKTWSIRCETFKLAQQTW